MLPLKKTVTTGHAQNTSLFSHGIFCLHNSQGTYKILFYECLTDLIYRHSLLFKCTDLNLGSEHRYCSGSFSGQVFQSFQVLKFLTQVQEGLATRI